MDARGLGEPEEVSVAEAAVPPQALMSMATNAMTIRKEREIFFIFFTSFDEII